MFMPSPGQNYMAWKLSVLIQRFGNLFMRVLSKAYFPSHIDIRKIRFLVVRLSLVARDQD